MGIVRWGPPEELVLILKRAFSIDMFIETGTFKGHSTSWAAAHFPSVISIEAGQKLYQEAKERYAHHKNIEFICGDGPTELAKIVPRLNEPAIFWLDSHWCGEDSCKLDIECPLIPELEALARSKTAHFILIDDARFFLSPPPRFHDRSQWPDIAQVIDSLRSGHADTYTIVLEDVIIAVPPYAKTLVGEYAQEVNEPPEPPAPPIGLAQVRRGKWLMKEGAKDVLYGLKSAVRQCKGYNGAGTP